MSSPSTTFGRGLRFTVRCYSVRCKNMMRCRLPRRFLCGEPGANQVCQAVYGGFLPVLLQVSSLDRCFGTWRGQSRIQTWSVRNHLYSLSGEK